MTTETSNAREWVLVPREPTQAMLEAFNDWRPTEGNKYAGAQSVSAQDRWEFHQRYAAMLASTPPPSAARGDVRGLVALAERVEGLLTAFGDSDMRAERDAIAADLRALAAEGVQAGEVEQRAREADRQRFSDPEFNAWLDTGISDAGHTVWDAVGDTQAAWAGWEARQFAGDAVLISECCGREECGGECGNEWRGMTMCRKPAEALSQQPEARGVVDDEDGMPVGFAGWYNRTFRTRGADTKHLNDCEEAWRAALTGERNG